MEFRILSTITIAAAGQTPPNIGDFLRNPLVPMMLVMVVILFVSNRSQRKKIKEHQEALKTLKPGDKIITSSGIIGVVITAKEKSLSIRSADAKFEITRSAVAEITERAGASNES